jgi:hypothetical protein
MHYNPRQQKIPTCGQPAQSAVGVNYQKIYDGRKHRVRELWKRRDTFYAQLSLTASQASEWTPFRSIITPLLQSA